MNGDAGADARIIGFKKIINENGNKELVEIDSDTYTKRSLKASLVKVKFSGKTKVSLEYL